MFSASRSASARPCSLMPTMMVRLVGPCSLISTGATMRKAKIAISIITGVINNQLRIAAAGK